MSGANLRPVAATADYLARLSWNSGSDDFLFSDAMRVPLHSLIRWEARCNGLTTSRFGVHALRSGELHRAMWKAPLWRTSVGLGDGNRVFATDIFIAMN